MVRADLMDCVEKFLRLNGPRPERALRRPADDLHRRPLPAAARGHGPGERPLRARPALAPPRLRPARRSLSRPGPHRGPLRVALLLLGPRLRRARFRHGLHRAREGLPAERRRLHRPPQRHPQPLGRRHPDRPPQQPLRSGVHPARGRVLHHAHEHQRPGRRPQPREARVPPRPLPPLRGLHRGRVRPPLAPDRGGPRAQGRRPGHAPHQRPQGPLGQRHDRPRRPDPQVRGRRRRRHRHGRAPGRRRGRPHPQHLGALPLPVRRRGRPHRVGVRRRVHPVSPAPGLGRDHPQEPGQDLRPRRRRHRPRRLRPRPGLRRPQPLHVVRGPRPADAHPQEPHLDGLAHRPLPDPLPVQEGRGGAPRRRKARHPPGGDQRGPRARDRLPQARRHQDAPPHPARNPSRRWSTTARSSRACAPTATSAAPAAPSGSTASSSSADPRPYQSSVRPTRNVPRGPRPKANRGLGFTRLSSR